MSLTGRMVVVGAVFSTAILPFLFDEPFGAHPLNGPLKSA